MSDGQAPQLKLTRLADVTAERLEWIWPGYLPKGKIVTLDGDPGLGKSTLALNIAAVVSVAGRWPDQTRCGPAGDVLLLSAEDGLADTVRPRLDAAGADVSRVTAIEGKSYIDPESGERFLRPLSLGDVRDLDAAMAQTSARLLIVDVLMAFLPTGTDGHKDQDIRRVLSALAATGERHGCTTLLLRHLNKAKGGDPLYRGGGSIGIVGAARSGLLVAADPDDPTRRILASVKSNLGVMPASLAYRLVDSPEHGVARVEWIGASSFDAHGLLAAPRDDDPDAKGARRDVDDWLADLLDAGPVESNTVYEAADAAGFSKDKAKRAKVRLGVKAYRETGDGPWLWRLDTKGAAEQGRTPDSQNLAPLLPCTSSGVQNNSPDQGGTPAVDCTLAVPDARASDQSTTCRYCAEPLVWVDDIRDGYHSSKTICVKARRADKSIRSPKAPMTALAWITNHVAGLIAGGTETIECRPVYEAGVAAGFKIDNLRQAAKTCPLITQIGRNGSTTTIWRLGEGSGANEIVTASQWLAGWLTGREWMLAADVYTAAAQAGYSRSAIKSAALSERIAKRGQSIATQWALGEQPSAEQLSRCDVCGKELPTAATEPLCHGCGHTGLTAPVTEPASKSA